MEQLMVAHTIFWIIVAIVIYLVTSPERDHVLDKMGELYGIKRNGRGDKRYRKALMRIATKPPAYFSIKYIEWLMDDIGIKKYYFEEIGYPYPVIICVKAFNKKLLRLAQELETIRPVDCIIHIKNYRNKLITLGG